jgi:hypothetical protein
MTQLSNQEIFDKALFGIRAQNYAPSGTNESCQYRGENGTKCAVGHCIDDVTAASWDALDNGEITYVRLIRRESFEKFFDSTQLGLLRSLQKIHDDVLFNRDFESVHNDVAGTFENLMESLAEEYDLVYTSVIATNK